MTTTTRHQRTSSPARNAAGAFALLNTELQRAVRTRGYDQPTPIQEQCIEALLQGRDLLGSAQTGTGKTAAFTLPILHVLAAAHARPGKGRPQALILAPTRELAAQIDTSIEEYGRFLRLRHCVIFGGVNQFHQVRALERGVHLLTATPGRLLDLISQGHVHLDGVRTLVLDEADRMLDMGFIPDIRRILALVPEERQTLFFSATMAPKVEALAREMVTDPVRVCISPEAPAVERIHQQVMFVRKKDKDSLLVSLLRRQEQERGKGKVIVFTQMKHMANRVVKKLESAGISGAAIHGNKSQAARTRALEGFRRGRYQVLVATDVAARGIDVPDIDAVINYDLPVEAETYVHRIGRTARAGAGGRAVSFCSAAERGFLRDIERLLGQAVPADLDHELHSEEARRSTQAPERNFGRGGARRGGRSGGRPGRRGRRA